MKVTFKTRKDLVYRELIESIGARMVFFDDYDADEKAFCIRHDEDWDLDYSLALAEAEYEFGFRAVYFLNHSCGYFDYSRTLIDACRRLQDLGHQVGLHQNALEEHIETGRSVRDILARPLEFLRSNGIAVSGVSSHGSGVCRKHRVLNFEIWKEFEASEFAILKQSEAFDGDLGFERLPLADLDLQYDASLLSHSAYLSDSSGRLWGVYRTGSGHRSKIYDLIEYAEMMRGATVIKSNVKEIIDYFNSSTEAGLLHILWHPKFWAVST